MIAEGNRVIKSQHSDIWPPRVKDGVSSHKMKRGVGKQSGGV